MRKRAAGNGFTESPYFSEALQVAYYHCVLEMPLKTIAEMFGKSPATITRRLDEVRQAGWLRDRPEFAPPPEVWRELQGRMTCVEIERALQEHFGANTVRRITVLPSPSAFAGEAQQTHSQNVERVGLFAAQRIVEALGADSHVVGVNWGWSVRHCVTNLRPSKPNPELRFVPLIGNLSLDENDAHYEEAIECSSNRLAQLAASAFGAPRAPRLSTPAYIPRRFHDDLSGLRAIRDFIESDVSYRRIFGDSREPGLNAQVDTVVTGLSSIDVQTLPTYRPNLITESDLPVLEAAGVVGDLALHLIAEPHEGGTAPPEALRLVESINDLIVGASPADFVRVAERARSSETAGLGVVVLSVGAWKARILSAAIRMRAVNELITDLDTALAIGKNEGLDLGPRAQFLGVKV
jgi:DNA-binding transcriptional regulator LsrR (DeoR family)